jgi:hypothetical protein
MIESELRRNTWKKKKLRLNTAGQILGLGLASSAGNKESNSDSDSKRRINLFATAEFLLFCSNLDIRA